MFDLKIILRIAVFLIAALVAVFLILNTRAPVGADLTAQVSRDLVLFICSTVVSWMISAWFARKDGNDKIDAIAERSFEKMAMLTLQIERAKKFLVETIKLSQSESDPALGMNAYKHRINGSISSLDQISASNDTFRADWLGVVSDAMRTALSKKLAALSDVQEIVNDFSKGLESEGSDGAALDRKIQSAEREIVGAGRLIGELKSSKPTKPPVAEILQSPSGNQSDKVQQGTIIINVKRLTFRATGTGRLAPPMASPPEVDITLECCPPGADRTTIRFPVGTGTNFDFNIMLSSASTGTALPLGEYAFRYEARCLAQTVEDL